ncbi:MAG: GNAT family N-acetyltransferase [Cellulomonas sp.]|nr:GNAT family N-acetyltransferase [Cellulomonas sp.]
MVATVTADRSLDAAPDDLVVTGLTDPAHLQAAAQLYREVFGYTDPAHGVNPRLLSALAANGGSVVGVLTPDGQVAAFAYGFAGADEQGRTYHYSQAAVVAATVQGRGLGRRLKREQARIALAHGARTMRWAYDPLIARNAHFNLDVLGARARWFHPEFYGPGTDRLVVEWDITDTTPITAGVDHHDAEPPIVDPEGRRWGVPQPADRDAWYLPVPARINELAAVDPEAARIARTRAHYALPELFGLGLVAVSCRRVDELTSVYRFEPGADHPSAATA